MVFIHLEHIKFHFPLPFKNLNFWSTHKANLIQLPYTSDDQSRVIGNMAFVTDMTEQKKALALAAEVQKSLLPQTSPQVQGLDVAGKNVSCEEIGGDYFDFLGKNEYPAAPLSIVVGDITGHGVDAALLMTSARAFLRMRAAQSGNISDIVTEMNRHLALDVLDRDPAGNDFPGCLVLHSGEPALPGAHAARRRGARRIDETGWRRRRRADRSCRPAR